MNVPHPANDQTAPSGPNALCIAGDRPAALRGILLRDCAVACWRRAVPDELAGSLADLAHGEIDDIDADLALDVPALRLGILLGAAGYPETVAVPLAQDAAGLAALHAELWRWQAVRIRLEWIETDACRRFHEDQVTTRLLASYLGRGTQWKRSDAADDQAIEMRTGEVGIFQGTAARPGGAGPAPLAAYRRKRRAAPAAGGGPAARRHTGLKGEPATPAPPARSSVAGAAGVIATIAGFMGLRAGVAAELPLITARTETVALRFLPPGHYAARVYEDSATPTTLAVTERVVTAADTLALRLAASGGAAVQLRRLDARP